MHFISLENHTNFPARKIMYGYFRQVLVSRSGIMYI